MKYKTIEIMLKCIKQLDKRNKTRICVGFKVRFPQQSYPCFDLPLLATPSASSPHPSPSPSPHSLCSSSFCTCLTSNTPLSSVYTAGCCLCVSIVVLFVCIVSGVDNRPLGSIKDRMAAFQGNGKLCVCVCVCVCVRACVCACVSMQ